MAADAKDRSAGAVARRLRPLRGGELESAYPTTEGQRAIWASVALGMSDAVRAYNESVRIRLRGPLKLDAFRSAFNELVGRHEALRASFSPDGMTMCVSSEALLRLEVEDLSGRSESEWASRLDAIRREQALHVFDLVRGPAARAWLVRVTAEEHWFFFTGHHLICDGWSIAVVLYELGRLYSHRVTGVGEPLPPADRFGVYAERERTAFSGDERAKLERFWLEHFRDGIPSFEIPLDHPRPSERAYRAQRIDTELDSTLITQVRQVGQKHKASLVVTLAASFCAYVSRISGQSDVVLAVPAAGQALEGEEHLIGHCVNVMPIRMSVDPNESFTDFLARFRIAFMDAYEHQQVPFGALLRLLRVPRDPSRIPLVPVTFNVDTGMDNFDFAGMEATYFSSPKEFGDFEVTINAAQLRDRFVSECTFNTDLYTAESMERHMREWETLVRGIVQAPGTSVGELPLLDDAARRTIVEDWNDTAVDFPVTTLSALVEAQATVAPDRRALVFEGAQFTYGELDARANRLANHLIAAGVRPGAMVALVMERSAEMVIAALGIMKAGGAYVPVEPSYPAERVAFMFEDTSAEFVVTEAHSRDRIPRTTAKVVDVDADRAAIAGASAGAPARAPSPEDVAYVIYTSGSTGRPKGVLTPHRAAANYVQSMAVEPGVGPGDVVTAAASLGFDMSVFDIWVPLTSGATCVVLSREVTLDGRTLAAAMDAAAATISMLTPVSWRMMLDGGWAGSPKLRAMSGGEELSPELRTRLLPKVRELYNVYGPTETTVLSHFERVTNAAGPVAIGKPLKNVVAYILDGRGKPVPIGASGELCIGGAGVALGYHRRPELTREKFVPDPFRPGSTMYRSGDLAKFLPDGSVQWLGRIDHQVKIRGYRIELGEIEQAIVADPSIEQVVVEPRTLDGDKQLVAYVVVRSGAKLDEPELRAKLRGSLPPYMLPAQFVVLPALPVSASGKIDRKSLPDPVGEKRVVRAAAPQDQPQTPIEEVLMDVWEDVLGQRPRRTDNFFDLGGHSLQAMRVIEGAHLRGLSLRPAHMFQHPTLEGLALAASVRSVASDRDGGALVPLNESGTRPPLYFLHSVPGDLLHYGPLVQRLGPDQPCYGFQALSVSPADLEDWTITHLASHYVDILTEFQPEGPYHLVGWCFGGNVAVEMAQQLKRRGARVGFVGLMESWPVRGRGREAAHKTGQLLRMGRRAVPLLQEKAEMFLRGERAQDPLKVFALDIDAGPFKNRNLVYRRNSEALKTYRSTYYPGPVWLFEASEKPAGAIEDPHYGWRPFAEEVRSVVVEGEHEAMLKPPHVDSLAVSMRAAIDEAQARRTR